MKRNQVGTHDLSIFSVRFVLRVLSGPRAAAALLPLEARRGRISTFLPQVEECVLNLGKFHNIVRLVAFCPFSSSQVALENANLCV